jgi:hypothetical protein
VVFTDTEDEDEEVVDKNKRVSKKKKGKAGKKRLGENLADISEEIVEEEGLKKRKQIRKREGPKR